jgi:DNA modification methylase
MHSSDEASSKRIRDLVVKRTVLSSLKPNPRNARTHSKRQLEAIAASIREFGFTNPVLVDDGSNVLAGHGRLEAAKLLGLPAVPTVQISDLSDAQKRAYVLADNRLAERAGWDRATLALELGELSLLLPDLGMSVDLTGFEVGEIDTILADTAERAASADDEPVPEPSAPVSRLGDLWCLGRHRLLCGDARDGATVRQLLGDERADMVFTDPPYNASIGGHVIGKGRTTHPEFAMASGEMTEGEFSDFLRVVLQNAADVSRSGALAFICVDWRHVGDLLQAGKVMFSEVKNFVVWANANGGMGSLYRSAHEFIVVFKVGEGEHVNNVELGKFVRNRTNVWQYAGVNTFGAGRTGELASHPTVKPVALIADAIKDVTRRDAVVLDLFGGSGTTLIACERTGRRARLLEREPRYADVTIRRFEKLIKLDAIHAETGATYSDLAQSRQLANLAE